MTDTYKIFGGPGSPYSHKVRAAFRYRRIPHTWTIPQGEFSGGGTLGSDSDGEGSHLQKAAKGVVPVVLYPDGTYKADSTPLILELDELYPERKIVPPNPGIAFLAHLIEDMADEFLPIPMFHYRWTDDQVWCGKRQMFGWNGPSSDEELDEKAQAFLDRQSNQLKNSGRGAPQRELMEAAWVQFMEVMEEQLRHNLFLFGTRPSLAEFGIYGQLTQYAVDPTVSAMMKEQAVRTYQWTHYVDDLSGIEGEWFEPEACLTESLAGFLRYTATFYVAMIQMIRSNNDLEDLANAANGMKYRLKCFLALKQELTSLSPEDRDLIKPILQKTGCWEPLQFEGDETTKVVPVLPL